MSPIREKFIKIIDSLPYDLDKEVLNKNTKEILQDVTKLFENTEFNAFKEKTIKAILVENGALMTYLQMIKNVFNH